jgi:hypothetical protein
MMSKRKLVKRPITVRVSVGLLLIGASGVHRWLENCALMPDLMSVLRSVVISVSTRVFFLAVLGCRT